MIYELRRYTMVPGARDVLIDLFEREFVETQEEAGMRVVGHFRNPDDPDQYPWIRSFPDMEARKAALTAFYSGPAWKANRDAANATMLDSDDVLLLRPVSAPHTPRLVLAAPPRPPTGPRPPVGGPPLSPLPCTWPRSATSRTGSRRTSPPRWRPPWCRPGRRLSPVSRPSPRPTPSLRFPYGRERTCSSG
ncbi:NIPSNAP family protein [Nonomuraea ferruginea]